MRSIKFYISCLLLGIVFAFLSAGPAGAAQVKVLVDGKDVALDVRPVIENGRTLVPLRGIFEKMGATVNWDSKTKTVTAVKGSKKIKLVIGSKVATKNNETVKLDVPAAVRNGNTLVPLRFVSEALGANVSFNKTDKTISVDTKVKVEYATGFSIEYIGDGCKKVVDGEGRTLLLVLRGKKVPDGYKGVPVIYTPIDNVLAASITQVSLLRPLNVLHSISGVTADKNDWYIAEIKKGLEKGSIKFVGGSNMGEPDYEKVQALNPQIVFAYTGAYGQQKMINKLSELGIKYAIDNEYLEEHPLGRMEWIKFLGAFYNKEAEATAYFNNAVKAVNALNTKIPKGTKPKVLWGSIYKGEVYVPNGGSYVAKMIEMAGGDYVFKDLSPNKGSSSKISIEEFYAKGIDADIFIYSSTTEWTGSVQDIIKKAPVLAELNSIKKGNVWCFQPWYYQVLDKTHETIQDLAVIFHPSAFKGYSVKHYDKVPMK